MSLRIKNAQLVNGEIVTVLVKGDCIYAVNHRTPIADRTIDAKGKVLFPGIIDPHVHFRVPGAEHKEDWTTGSMAAAAGGVTTVLDMPNNSPAITTIELLEKKRRMIAGKTQVNYGLYMGATEENIHELQKADGICGVKVYLGSSTGDLLVRDYTVLEHILTKTDHVVAVHSEDEACLQKVAAEMHDEKMPPTELHAALRPEECAKISAEKVVKIIARVKKSVYFCHVSGRAELEVLQNARERGQNLYIEATPHHLLMNKDDVAMLGSYARVNPPLRSQDSQTYLQRALSQGIIDTIGTDHAPHTREEKEQAYEKAPSGMPGIETSLPALLTLHHKGMITLQRIAQLMCENPARIFHIKNRGRVEEGYFADLTLVDLDLTRTVKDSILYTKCGWSPFSGMTFTGWPLMTIVNGQIVYDGGTFGGERPGREVYAFE